MPEIEDDFQTMYEEATRRIRYLEHKLEYTEEIFTVSSEALKVTNDLIDEIGVLTSKDTPFFRRANVIKQISQVVQKRFA